MKTRFILTGVAILITALLVISCGNNVSNETRQSSETNETLLGDENNYNWGKPKKLSRPKVANTLNLNFAVFGDPQPDLNMYGTCTYYYFRAGLGFSWMCEGKRWKQAN